MSYQHFLFLSSVSMATFPPSLPSICHLLFYYLHLLITCYFFTSAHYFFLCSILPNYWLQGLKNLLLVYTAIIWVSICNCGTCASPSWFLSTCFSNFFKETFIITFNLLQLHLPCFWLSLFLVGFEKSPLLTHNTCKLLVTVTTT